MASDIEERLELDYQLGEDIKEKLIPHAVDWFTGEALGYEELDEEDLEHLEDDDEDEDDDLSDDQDEDEESDEDVCYEPPFDPHMHHIFFESMLTWKQDNGGKPKQETAECKQS